MKMKTLYTIGKYFGHTVGSDTKSGTRTTGVVNVGFYHRAHWVYAQSAAYRVTVGRSRELSDTFDKALKLCHRVECDVRAATHIVTNSAIGVCRAIGVGEAVKLIDSKLHLIERAGSGSYSILAENGKSAPQGICLECHDYFSTGAAAYVGN